MHFSTSLQNVAKEEVPVIVIICRGDELEEENPKLMNHLSQVYTDLVANGL